MTYAIVAVVLLVVVVLIFVLARKKPEAELPAKSAPASGAQRPLPAKQAQAPAAAPESEGRKSVPSKPETRKSGPPASIAKELESVELSIAPEFADAVPHMAPPSGEVSLVRKGLARSRDREGFFGKLAAIFTGRAEIDPSIADAIEEVLLASDVGAATTQLILGRLRERLDKRELASSDAVWGALREETARILSVAGGGGLSLRTRPTVVLMVGVNGVGKTTTIGKLSTKLAAEQKTLTLAAGDTFRAAAVQQLEIWGKRVGCEVVKGKEGSDPASVAFNAIQTAKEKGVDVVLVDTAGRLQTKTPLMDELKKIARTMQKAMEGAPHETLLVLDATNGQNAITQAKMFQEAIPLSGIVLTKLDGTAKGGVILGICDQLKIPVRYIGLGERPEDLREFVADEFVEALLGEQRDETSAA